ncbi:DoxX family protein [Marininema halotolerans]|uniref:Uncharacterized membrane protein n=1 Tax=Marininema halotolerans TaxID=1155944 RepID=A0A1I6Q1Y5_9BACL|nr:DoxX family protein [Marininema halotolerans]SFS46422.1 Uncharacterized membrane protein [Marininema halotolerans]
MSTARSFGRTSIPRLIGLVLFAILLFNGGIAHFTKGHDYANMLPSWMPLRDETIWVTGVLEMLLAILLLIPRTRRLAGWVSAIFLVLIFPANIYSAIAQVPFPGQNEANPVALWIRLLFQPLLIIWVLWATRTPKKS